MESPSELRQKRFSSVWEALTKTFLDGENAESCSQGILFGDNEQCFDVSTETIHTASRTKCNMMTKVVLNDNAKAVYRGLVRVNPKAVKCEGYQKNDTILLSENAEADAVPNLEIENNDVKCSHGATISQIDEMKLFYMMSRGIDEKSAKKQIVEGFFDPILANIENDKIKDDIKNKSTSRIRGDSTNLNLALVFCRSSASPNNASNKTIK